MRERPILFSGPMVRAILAGTKTQTRRVVKSGDKDDWNACPYGGIGQHLWVRERCRAHELTDKEAREDTYGVMERLGLEQPMYGLDGVIYWADGAFREIDNTVAASERWMELNHYGKKVGRWVPPIHMPRWASRITLEITAVRVERLQEISEEDARAEGVEAAPGTYTADFVLHGYVKSFKALWDTINGKRAPWASNPWVRVVQFRRIMCPT